MYRISHIGKLIIDAEQSILESETEPHSQSIGNWLFSRISLCWFSCLDSPVVEQMSLYSPSGQDFPIVDQRARERESREQRKRKGVRRENPGW